MQLLWTNTASIALKSGETILVFDPFLGLPAQPDAVERKRLLGVYRRASAILVTHGHFDHILHIPLVTRRHPVLVYTTKTPAKTLEKAGLDPELICEIRPGSQIQIGSFEIEAYQGKHCRFDGKILRSTLFGERTRRMLPKMLRLIRYMFTYREHGEILMYELRCEGKRIQVLGSMNLDAKTEYPTDADLLILPLQGRSDQDTYALRIVEKLLPKWVLLDHYDDTFPPMTSPVDPGGFEENVKGIDIPCERMEAYHLYTI